MILCLSSGARPQYRDDILRACSLEAGSELPFRYSSSLLEPALLEKVRKGEAIGEDALIAYLNRDDRSRPPLIIPCRHATIERAGVYGSTVSLTFRLAGFTRAEDLNSFGRALTSAVEGSLPAWNPEEDGQIAGNFCLQISTPINGLTDFAGEKNEELAEWEELISSIAGSQDFSSRQFFYLLRGIYERDKGGVRRKAPIKNGAYEIGQGTDCELELYHYYPGEKATFLNSDQVKLEFVFPSDGFLLRTTTAMRLDSNYDLKRIRFKCDYAPRQRECIVGVYSSSKLDQSSRFELDLGLRIKSSVWLNIGLATLIGILLAASQVVSAWIKFQESDDIVSAMIVSATSLVAGIGVGFCAIYGIKKGI